MEDQQVLNRIEALVAEEQELLKRQEHGPLDADTQARNERIRVHLDQCWDLLRQRRALREFGQDPDSATVRSEATVEQYEQ